MRSAWSASCQAFVTMIFRVHGNLVIYNKLLTSLVLPGSGLFAIQSPFSHLPNYQQRLDIDWKAVRGHRVVGLSVLQLE